MFFFFSQDLISAHMKSLPQDMKVMAIDLPNVQNFLFNQGI